MQRILSRAFPSTSSTLSASATPFYVDRRPPPDLGKWANFKRFVWNKEKHTFCNRTFSSWIKIIFFYAIFVLIMLGIFFLLLFGVTDYIRKNYRLPWIPKQHLIKGGHPGAAFLPNILKIKAPLIWYSFQGNQSRYNMKYEVYVKRINEYFRRYDYAQKHPEIYDNCDVVKNPTKPCIFLRNHMEKCGKDNFGYDDKKPCFYIKLNRLPGWRPKYFHDGRLPREMPDSLKNVIQNSKQKKKIWLHCEGMQPGDQQHVGNFSYYPHQGFNGYYFPYTGHKHYLTPLVAVKIDDIKKGYVINIQCSIWAKNILYDYIKHHSAFIQLYLALD